MSIAPLTKKRNHRDSSAISLIIGGTTLAAGILVIIGWAFDIEVLKRPIADLVAMNPLTAICFILSGLSLLILSGKRMESFLTLSQVLSILIILISLVKLINQVAHSSIQIDQLMFSAELIKDTKGNVSNNMAPNTALGFVLTALALLFSTQRPKRIRSAANYLSLAVFMLGFFSVIGYLYNVGEFYGILKYFPMSLHTALFFMLVGTGIVFMNKDYGFMRILMSPYSGGKAAKIFIPCIVIIPILLGYLRMSLKTNTQISDELSLSLLIVSIITALLILTWYLSKTLNESDISRERLLENQTQHQNIIDSIEDYAIITLDNRGIIKSWNKGAEKIKGYTPEEIIGKNFSVFFPPDAQKANLPERLLTDAKQKGKIESAGWRIRKNGLAFWSDALISSQIDLFGKVSGFIKITRDTTDTHEYSEKLKRSEAKFRNLLESAPDAMIVVNREGIIELANQQSEKMFGYTREEIQGNLVEILIPNRLSLNHHKHRQDFFSSPKVRGMGANMDLLATRKDGSEFPVEVSLSPLVTDKGTIAIAAIRDITEKKKSEEAALKVAELIKSKNQEMEQLTYVASHDLREPLLTIKNYVRVLKEDCIDILSEEAELYISSILRATGRMDNLITGLLDYSRLGVSKKIEMVNLEELLISIQQDLDKIIDVNKATIKVNPMPTIPAYPLEIKLLFQNLIHNAIKFHNNDTHPVITISSKKIKKGLQFEVKDNGIGIDEKNRSTIFTIFRKLHKKKEYEGTGIGLAHAKKIVEIHNGTIWVESELNKGSSFFFTILDKPL
ncbi:PAS domain S-box-containing protein [Reichenbachiella faecimaris]|uniref:histidine kinase n=1 Tax=Reichenbachiella faecimaris TaxID=692418 RepID=A0A1W2GHG2_REIFA|nr:PAS domain S-box protein [Reichenbachiella faecimaris]SMD36011.1 PAS domain S-box-containing protein [Reichenbachiella faecimaris]